MARRRSASGRILKWTAVGVGGILILFLAAAGLIPFLFKDQIHAKIKSEINNQVLANVDYRDVSLSVFSNFPYLTFGLDDFSIVGRDAFARDSLIALDKLEVAVNIMSVIRGEKIEVKKIVLNRPRINAKVLYDGRANWDIMKPDSVAKEDTTPPSHFAVQLTKIIIEDGNVRYEDQPGKMLADIKGLNFKGGGDMTDEQFDFETHTFIKALSFEMDKTTYAHKLEIEADVTLDIDQKQNKYAFKENKFRFNDLRLGFDGSLELPNDKDIVMNVSFQALETRFKNILSLVPGVFTKDFENIRTDGVLALDGKANGTYNEQSTPAFTVNLKVKDGYLQYPDLPAPVKNINIDFTAQNATDNLDNTTLNLRRFHAELEDNPVDCNVMAVGLKRPRLEGQAKAKVKLDRMQRIFPIAKFDVKGDLNLDASFNGEVADSTLPVFNVNLDLRYGYLKYADFPTALENLTISVSASNETGHINDTHIDVRNFHTEMDKEPLDGAVQVDNLDSPSYKLYLKGSLDLAKLMKIYPIEGTTLLGKLVADVNTEGSMAQIEKKDYKNLATRGSVNLTGFEYRSKDVAQPVKIQKATLLFTNANLKLTEFEGLLGSSDVRLNGTVDNYLGYIFKDEPIRGKMTLSSNTFNVNEWMSDDDQAKPDTASTPMAPVDIPANVDFTFASNIGKVIYDTYEIKKFRGTVHVHDKKVELTDMAFALLGGAFKANGFYSSENLNRPEYQMRFNIDSLGIKEAYNAFVTIQHYMPIAKEVDGLFSGGIGLQGFFKPDMMPDLATLTGDGLVDVIRGRAAKFPIMQALNEKTKLKTFDELNLKHTKFNFFIKDGRLHVSPFELKQGNTNMVIGGSNGLDKTIAYDVKLNLPAGAVTQQASAALSGLAGRELPTAETATLDLNITGTADKPKISGGKLSFDGKSGLKEAAKEAVKEKVEEVKKEVKEKFDEKKKEVEDKAKQEAARLKQEAEDRARQEQEKLKQEGEKKKKEVEDKLRQEQERLKQEAEKKKKEEEERLKKEAEKKLKDKLKLPR